MKLTQKQISENARNNFFNKVEERKGKVLGEYKNNLTPVKVECHKGHPWDAIPKNIKAGNWCPKCIGKNAKSGKNKLIKKVEENKGKILGEYKNRDTSILIECDKGHTWDTSPHNIFNGSWCPYCYNPNYIKNVTKKTNKKELDSVKNKTLKGKEKFIKIMDERKGKILGEYKNTKTKIKIGCDKNHTWDVEPRSIIAGSWCGECLGNNTTQGSIKFSKIVKVREGIILGTYKNSITKIKLMCKKGHVWETEPYNIMKGSWCHTCCESHGEREIRLYLEKNNINYKPQYPIKVNNINLFFDFYMEVESKKLLIEFDGIQHFEIGFFHVDENDFENRKNKDYIKSKWAVVNGYNLIRIHCDFIKKIDKILDIELKEISQTECGDQRYYSKGNDCDEIINKLIEEEIIFLL